MARRVGVGTQQLWAGFELIASPALYHTTTSYRRHLLT